MKSSLQITLALAAVLGLVSQTKAVSVNIVPFTNDPSNDYPGIGISPTTVYTHLLDFVDDNNPDTINTVAFTAAGQSGGNYSLTNVGSVFGFGSGDLLGDFFYGSTANTGTVETDVISGLTAGQYYDLRFYTGPFGSRPQTVVFTNGLDTDTRTYDPGDNTQYLSYAYQAQGASVTVTFTSLTDNNTFHQYAITNQVVPEPSSLTLLGLGIVGLFGLKRRQRTAKS